MRKTTLKKLNFFLIVILLVLSAYIFVKDFFGDSFCIVGDNETCSIVQNSQYGRLFGVKVSLLGAVSFLVLLVLYMLANSDHEEKETFHKYYIYAVCIGIIGALYFILIQFLVIKQLCSSCLVIDTSMIILGLSSFYEYFILKKRR